MTHVYKTTHARHKALHGLSFTVEALTLMGIVGGFQVHWVLGICAVPVMLLANGFLKLMLDCCAAYQFLHKDCGVRVTWKEAYKLNAYFSPNQAGRWLNARFLRELPRGRRHQALLDAVAAFDAECGSPGGIHAQSDVPSNQTCGCDSE